MKTTPAFSTTLNFKTSKVWPLFALVLILFLSVGLRHSYFSRTEYAIGSDGYFHVIQAKSLYEEGKTHAPDSSLTPQLLLFTYKIVGDWEKSQKVFLSAVSVMMILAAYFFFRLFFKDDSRENKEWLILIPTALFAFSPTQTYIIAQFAKQTLGLSAFLIFLILFFNLTRKEKAEWWDYTALFVSAVLCLFTHRIYGVLAFASLPFLLNRKILLIGGAVGITMLILGTFFVPGIVSLVEIERFSGILNGYPSFYPLNIFRQTGFHLGWLIEMLLFFFAFGMITIERIRVLKEDKKAFFQNRFENYFWFLMLLGAFPFFNMDSLDMGFRLFITAVSLTSIPSAMILKRDSKAGDKKMIIGGLIIALAFLILRFNQTYRLEGLPNFGVYHMIADDTEEYFAENDIEPEILVMHHGLSFYYTYLTSRHTFPFEPGEKYNKTNTYRLAFGISDFEWERYLPEDGLLLKFGDYDLIREDVWDEFVDNALSDGELSNKLSSYLNPSEERPEFLNRQYEE